MNNFIVTAYYTEETLYAEHAKNLIHSLKAHDLAYKVVPIKNQGDWYKNTQYKPRFLRQMIEELKPCPIVYVDVDAVFLQYPQLFDELAKDKTVNLAAHLLDHNLYRRKGESPELLSGTVYFANNSQTRRILDEWILECQTDPLLWDQVALHRVAEKHGFTKLPASYCQIFDYMASVENPVITHFQASRTVRKLAFDHKKGIGQPRMVTQNGIVRIRRVHG